MYFVSRLMALACCLAVATWHPWMIHCVTGMLSLVSSFVSRLCFQSVCRFVAVTFPLCHHVLLCCRCVSGFCLHKTQHISHTTFLFHATTHITLQYSFYTTQHISLTTFPFHNTIHITPILLFHLWSAAEELPLIQHSPSNSTFQTSAKQPISNSEESVQSVTFSLLMPPKQKNTHTKTHSCIPLFCQGLIITALFWLAAQSIFSGNFRKFKITQPG